MQSLVQSPEGHELQETAHAAVPVGDSLGEASRRWANLLACGALTPGLLSVLALSVGFGGTLAWAPVAQAEPTLLAASEANGPLVAFQKPTHADQLNGKAQIGISIQGRRYPAKWVELLVDDYAATKGGPVQLDASMLPVAHFEWDTRVYADGPHKLSVIVTDSQGFKGRSDVQVYINNKGGQDIIPPTVRWVNVRNGDVLRGEFPVQVEATDNFGVKWVIVSLNPAISPTMKPALRGALLNIPPYIFRLNTSGLPASRYVLNAEAFDALDNRGTAPPIEVLIGAPFTSGTHISSPTPPEPTKSIIDIPPAPGGPSGGETTNSGVGTKNTGSEPPREANSGQKPPALPPTLSLGARTVGTDALPGVTPDYPLERAVREPAAPRQTLAALPPAQARSSASTQMTRAMAKVEGATSLPAMPVESRLPHRETRVAKLNAAQPAGAMRSVPHAGDVAAPARNAQTLPPLTAPVVTSNVRPARVAQSTLPPVENRIAVTPTLNHQNTTPAPNKVMAATPQLSRSGMAAVSSNVARTESHAVKAPVNAPALASVPGAMRRDVPKSALLPQVTKRSSLPNIAIARSFPEIKARLSMGPTLAVLPAAVKIYPEMPTPDLTPNLTKGNITASLIKSPGAPRPAFNTQASRNSRNGLPALPNKLPSIPAPVLAMNPAMPRTNALRPLESITVAPMPQWGTKAEVLPTSHTVLRNESLSSIARRYKMPVAVLAAANNLKMTSGLQIGEKLNLPRALQVTYGGQSVKTDAASFMMGSVGVTPFRFLFEKQGGKLDWDAKTRKVTAKGPQGNVELTIGSRSAVVNQKETLMDLAAFLMSGRTIVPVRFFEQALHAQVQWDPATGRLYVATTGSPAPKG